MSNNRVWIEIENPYKDNGKEVKGRSREEADRIGAERAQAISRMLRRLGILETYKGEIVWWDTSEKRRGYCWTTSEAGTFVYTTHSEPGMWYNLDWLGREA